MDWEDRWKKAVLQTRAVWEELLADARAEAGGDSPARRFATAASLYHLGDFQGATATLDTITEPESLHLQREALLLKWQSFAKTVMQ